MQGVPLEEKFPGESSVTSQQSPQSQKKRPTLMATRHVVTPSPTMKGSNFTFLKREGTDHRP